MKGCWSEDEPVRDWLWCALCDARWPATQAEEARTHLCNRGVPKGPMFIGSDAIWTQHVWNADEREALTKATDKAQEQVFETLKSKKCEWCEQSVYDCLDKPCDGRHQHRIDSLA